METPLNIIQITDAHLGREPGTQLLGVDTDYSLDQVLEHIDSAYNLNEVDLLLCTGDIANHSEPEAYVRFKKKLDALNVPQLWLSGNHDEYAIMQQSIGANAPELATEVSIDKWTILTLNSAVPGDSAGAISMTELQDLAHRLDRNRDQHIIIAVHHHVMPVGSDWIDEQQIQSDALLALLATHKNVKMIVTGHVHQEFEGQYEHIKVISSPSTCIQFAPKSQEFKVCESQPGFRHFTLWNDGRYDSLVTRVEMAYPLSLDLAASGY